MKRETVPASAPAVVTSPLGQNVATPSVTPPRLEVEGCHQVSLDQTVAFLCVERPPVWAPFAQAVPGVVTAVVGFLVVHNLSVRRQRRDEQFKMVQSTRDLVAEVAEEAREAWSKKSGRARAAQTLIHRVASVSRAAQLLRLRHKKFELSAQVVAFRRAITADFESGSVALSKRQAIADAAADLDEQIYRSYISIYG